MYYTTPLKTPSNILHETHSKLLYPSYNYDDNKQEEDIVQELPDRNYIDYTQDDAELVDLYKMLNTDNPASISHSKKSINIFNDSNRRRSDLINIQESANMLSTYIQLKKQAAKSLCETIINDINYIIITNNVYDIQDEYRYISFLYLLLALLVLYFFIQFIKERVKQLKF